jgi:hypothetical protein
MFERMAKKVYWYRVNLRDPKRRLDRQRCDGRGSKQPMGSEGLEVRCDASSAGRIMAGDGEDGQIVRPIVLETIKRYLPEQPSWCKPYHTKSRFASEVGK